MKNLILMIVVCLFAISCSDEQQFATPGTNPNSHLKTNPCGNWPPQHLVTQFPNINSEPFCTYPCMNCFYPVTIVGTTTRQFQVYKSFLSHYTNNTLLYFFAHEDWQLIFPDLTSEVLAKYNDGSYKLIVKDSADEDVKLVIVTLANATTEPLSDKDAIVVYQLKAIEE